MNQGWGDGSVGQMLAVQAQQPEFESSESTQKPGVAQVLIISVCPNREIEGIDGKNPQMLMGRLVCSTPL